MDGEATNHDHPNQPQVWKFWPTIGISFFGYSVSNIVILLLTVPAIIIALALYGCTTEDVIRFTRSGLIYSLSHCISSPLIIVTTLYFIKLRKGLPLRDYLCLRNTQRPTYIKWLLIFVLYDLASIALCYYFKKSVSFTTILNYQTAGFLPLLWFVYLIVAPVTEEILYRGFLFKGIQESRLGNIGAVLLTTLIWTGMHYQYDTLEMGIIFILGIVLGIARLQTNSLYIPLMIHFLNNLHATISIAQAAKITHTAE